MIQIQSPPLSEWFTEARARIERGWDCISLTTGEEGTWKSLLMRKFARKVDPKFNVDHIHFKQEDFLEDVQSLEPGRAAVLDEWKGNRRQAMHGFRMDWLDWTKDNREQMLYVFVGYPHVGQVETETLNTRIAYWLHKPNRPKYTIRRRSSKLVFTPEGEPKNNTKFPVFGNYTMTGDNDPLRSEYETKKQAHMRGKRVKREDGSEKPAFNREALKVLKVAKGK